MNNLISIIHYIVNQSIKLKNKYTGEIDATIEFSDIFSRDNDEYRKLTDTINKIGKIVYTAPTGHIYSLKKPIMTVAGKLSLIKIRRPENKFRFRGDADFDTDYPKLKQQYQDNPHFELIVREKFEMLRLSDPIFMS